MQAITTGHAARRRWHAMTIKIIVEIDTIDNVAIEVGAMVVEVEGC